MRREGRLLLERAIDSLVVGIELFNRPSDRGRVESVLIMLDHSLEMLLKAAILEKKGRIRERGQAHTIAFEHCVRIATSEGPVRFLNEDDTVLLRSLNGLRDAAQHYLIDLSEQHLYIQAQAAVTLVRRVMKIVFDMDLSLELPDRVLPLSTTPPMELTTLFDAEIEQVRKLLEPGKRQRLRALAKLRGLSIVNSAITGGSEQPSPAKLFKLGIAAAQGKSLNEMFPGVSTVTLSTTGTGPAIELRITKQDGVPVHLIRDDADPATAVIAVKRVDDLGFYNLGRNDLAEKLGMADMMTSAMIWHLKLQCDPECHKEVTIGKQRFHRYSQKAIARIKDALASTDQAEVWTQYKRRPTRHRQESQTGSVGGEGLVVSPSATVGSDSA